MITLTTKQQVILRHLDGESNRTIAKLVGIDKNTVNSYVNEYDKQLNALMAKDPSQDRDALIEAIVQAPAYDTSSRGPRAATEEVVQEIQNCLDENKKKLQRGMGKQQMRATDIHDYLTREKGFKISYSTVKKLVRKMRDDAPHEAFVRQEHAPGQVCEFDWGEVKLNIGGTGYRKYQMAAMASAYGNYRFGMVFRAQDTAAFQEAHAEFFKFCHGIYHTVVYDNMRVAVRKFVGPTEKEPTEALVQLSTYYHFAYRFCNVRRGNEKSHVERSVDVLRHAAFTKPGEDTFDSLEDANRHLLKRCMEKNNSPLSDGRIPAKTFEEEKPYLMKEMPELPCFIKKVGCRVDKYSTVSVNYVRYSVPEKYAEKKVDARVYTSRIVFYDGKEVIATHPRSFQQGSYHLDIFHYLETLKRKPGALPQSTALLQSDTLIKTIYEKHYSTSPKTFLEVLDIIKEYGAQSVADAIDNLMKISPADLSADKIRAVIKRPIQDKPDTQLVITDKLDITIQGTLSQYDRLMGEMSGKERMAG